MRLISKLSALAVLTAATTGLMSAETINLASYGTTASAPAGVGNTATAYFDGSIEPTYNIGTGGTWGQPLGSSSWVSFNSQSFPGGTYVAPDGSYIYGTAFLDNAPVGSSFGGILLMADDTASVYLNGHLLISAAAANPATHCTVGAPNCMTPTYVGFTSSDFVVGENVVEFVVNQDFENGTGLDFAGSVAATPEPGSLFLLGTGLIGSAGSMLRRMRS